MSENDFIPQIKPGEIENQANTFKLPNKNGKSEVLVSSQTDTLKKVIEKQEDNPEVKKKKKRPFLKRLLVVLLIFVGIHTLLIFNLALKIKTLSTQAKQLKAALTAQDMVLVKKELEDVEKSVKSTRTAYAPLGWASVIPYLGSYVSDGRHAVNAGVYGVEVAKDFFTTIEPYADLLGFKGGAQSSNGEKTAAERIDFIVKALPSITSEWDSISEKMVKVKNEVDKISPQRYPEKVFGKEIRGTITKGLALIDDSADFIISGKPILEQAPYLLGMDSPRTYLVLFQNDKELRPTGGFMTAYSIMKVDKAKFDPTDSSDIYNLDAKYKPVKQAPKPLVDHIKGPYILSQNIRLRDMNWSPDFSVSMELFTTEAKEAGLGDIDGVIAVDTQLLVNLLDVLGPIGVSGFGTFSTDIVSQCNCPQVIYELESFADVEGPIVWDPVTGKIVYRPPNSDNRKRIIGPLMNAILANTLGQPKEKIPDLFEAGYKSIQEKNIIFYLFYF